MPHAAGTGHAQCSKVPLMQVSHGSGFVMAKLSGKPGWSSPLPFHVTTTGVGVTIGYSEVGTTNEWNLTKHPCCMANAFIRCMRHSLACVVQVDTLMVLDSAEAVEEFLKTQVRCTCFSMRQDSLS